MINAKPASSFAVLMSVRAVPLFSAMDELKAERSVLMTQAIPALVIC
jgi:hypothetical protein